MSLIIATASIAPGSENSNSVIGKWKVNSNFGIYEQSRQAEFAFKDDGTFIVDSDSGYTGTWTQSGDAIHLEYSGGRAVYNRDDKIKYYKRNDAEYIFVGWWELDCNKRGKFLKCRNSTTYFTSCLNSRYPKSEWPFYSRSSDYRPGRIGQ